MVSISNDEKWTDEWTPNVIYKTQKVVVVECNFKNGHIESNNNNNNSFFKNVPVTMRENTFIKCISAIKKKTFNKMYKCNKEENI